MDARLAAIRDELAFSGRNELIQGLCDPATESGYLEAYLEDTFGDMDYLLARIEALERALAETITWCDERRNAPDVTTLGMVQDRLRAALQPSEEAQ